MKAEANVNTANNGGYTSVHWTYSNNLFAEHLLMHPHSPFPHIESGFVKPFKMYIDCMEV